MTEAVSDPLGRRERKKQATRRALEDAAMRLFAERGFDATTVEDITEDVDVAQRTFFRYFASKEEVVLGAPERLHGDMAAALAEQSDDTPLLEAVLAAVAGLDPEGRFANSEAGRARLGLRAQVAADTPSVRSGLLSSYAAQEQAIAEYVARRTGLSATTDVYPQMFAACVSAAMRVGLSTWLADGRTADVTEVFRGAAEVAIGGLGAPEPAIARRPQGAAAG